MINDHVFVANPVNLHLCIAEQGPTQKKLRSVAEILEPI
jgi:hypothetical protein